MTEASPTETRSDQTDTPEMAKLEIRKSADAELSVGGLRLVACRREVDVIDGGITLYVWSDGVANEGASNDGGGGADGEAVELVRIDLFRERPHYHAPATNDAEVTIQAGEAGSIAWGVEALTTRAPALVEEAGFTKLAAALDRAALAAAGPAIRALLDGLAEPTEISHFEVPASLIASLRA